MVKRKSNGGEAHLATSSKKKKSNPSEIDSYRKNNDITLVFPKSGKIKQDKECFQPLLEFSQAKSLFHKTAKHMFKYFSNKFKVPTPIQAQSWGILNADHDLVGVAETGSGKTLAFAVPVLSKIFKKMYKSKNKENLSNKKVCSPLSLVISPTRELAIQSFNVFKELCNLESKFGVKVEPVVIYGGTKRFEQAKKLKSKLVLNKNSETVVIATVGRLLDFIEGNEINLDKVEYVILDEADRMLDQGFEKEIRKIMNMISNKRQTIMFSATWPKEIRKIASEFMNNPIRVCIGSDELSANKKVDQKIIVLEPRAKERQLTNILMEEFSEEKGKKIIVFALYKKESSRIEMFLQRQGFKAVALNGDKSQSDREKALNSFLSGENNILVATDVASRGLDIKNVSIVINYTFPLTIEDYIHRIGRTGRAGTKGKSITFFTSHEKHLAGSLQNILRKNNIAIPEELKKFGNTVKKKVHGMYGAHFRDIDDDLAQKKSKHIKF